jgi:nucleoid-associated protein YgaU
MRALFQTTALTVALAVSANAASAQDVDMEALTALVVSGINGANPAEEVAEAMENGGDIEGLITQALKEGESDAYLDALLGEAIGQGAMEVPDEMFTPRGEVDRAVLLASLVSKSLGGDGFETVSGPDVVLLEDEAQGSEELVLAAATTAAEPQAPARPSTHTVASGDSLAAISLKYYGTTTDYAKIFEANKDKLRSPNLIQVGQVLALP